MFGSLWRVLTSTGISTKTIFEHIGYMINFCAASYFFSSLPLYFAVVSLEFVTPEAASKKGFKIHVKVRVCF